MFDLDHYDDQLHTIAIMKGHNDVERTLLVRFAVLDADTKDFIDDFREMLVLHESKWHEMSEQQWEAFKEANLDSIVAQCASVAFTQH